ncbi:MAG: hypothetical protein HY900_23075 [Deltaproteobacteria bacterium]|nr:hypothetical protein [Deltaproteobacteria bacterium]
MAMLDGKCFADERLLDAAGHVLHAYYRAPLVTGRLPLKAVVLTGEHLDPVIELVERMDQKLDGAAKDLFFPLYVDHMCLKVAREEGYSPVVVSMGADYTHADLGWDCGACGFATCGEYARYAKDNTGMGALCAGPSCAWKALDHGIAVDYACAAAHELSVENRILSTIGLVTMVLGYLEGVSATWALALGPQVETWWYSRPSLKKWMDPAMLDGMLRKNYANHFQMFSTKLRPRVKKDGRWWEEKPEYVLGIGPDEEYGRFQQQVVGALFESIGEVRPKVQALLSAAKSKEVRS